LRYGFLFFLLPPTVVLLTYQLKVSQCNLDKIEF
jgi:hypothetical protein